MHVRQVKNTWGMKNPWWFLKYNRLDPQHLEIDFTEATPTCTYFCFSPPYCRFYRRSQLKAFLLCAFLTFTEIRHWLLKTVMPG